MNTNNGEWVKSRRFLFRGLFAVYAGAFIFLHVTSRYNDYYTLFGFHLQKQGLIFLVLVLAMLTGSIPAYVNAQGKVAKVSLLVSAAAFLLYAAVFVPRDMIKFNQRVNNGTLVERLGDIPPLMLAAYKGDLQEMERLIKSGVNVNARNDVNNTALHFAAGASVISPINRGSPAAVAYLIRKGADVNAQNNTQITPLMDAVYNANLESLQILLTHGADVNSQSKYDATALSEAIIRASDRNGTRIGNRYRDIAIELLAHGANPNFRDFTGRTPLQTAEKYHEDGLVKELKDHGAK